MLHRLNKKLTAAENSNVPVTVAMGINRYFGRSERSTLAKLSLLPMLKPTCNMSAYKTYNDTSPKPENETPMPSSKKPTRQPAAKTDGTNMLLITGMMVGYLASSVVSLLNFSATAEGVQSYMVWGMGHFGGVSLQQMPAYASVILLGLAGAFLLIKPLNALLLGERYAENLGVRVRRVRHALLVVTGLLTAVTTAFCGPVLFLDLAVPHLARMLLGTANHRTLLPLTALTGGGVALFCNLLCVLPVQFGLIPLNAVTPLIGAPVVIYVIIAQYRSGGFR